MTDVKELRDLIERLQGIGKLLKSEANRAPDFRMTRQQGIGIGQTLDEAASALQSLVERNEKLRDALKEELLDLQVYTDLGIIRARAIERRSALPPEEQS